MNKKRNDEEIREIVKEIRKDKKLSQQELAQMMNYANASRVSEFETGVTKNVQGFVSDFSKALDIDERKILYYDDSDNLCETIKSNQRLRYKVPNFKYSIITGILVFAALVFQIISSIIINETLKTLNVLISVLALLCGIIFLIIQWTTSENYVDKNVINRENITYLSSDNSRPPLSLFIFSQVLIVVTLTIVLALLCVNYQDTIFIIFYAIIILLEIYHTSFGFNVFKKESTKSGFIVYIFEFIILLIYLFFIMVISVGLQSNDINYISYLCLGFGEAILLLMILRMLNCNKFLKYRKVSEKQKK